MSEEEISCRPLPLRIWVKEENQKICRPCVLPLLVGWYRSELEETGHEDAGSRLNEIIEKEDVTPDEVAEELDNIKDAVKDEDLKKRLREFDCAVQVNEQYYGGEE